MSEPNSTGPARGTESHRHFRLDDSHYLWHTHAHTCTTPSADFNALHHHPPVEHAGFTRAELEPGPFDNAPTLHPALVADGHA